MDFMHDRLVGDDRKAFRLLAIIDIFTREYLPLEGAIGFCARDVVQILSRLVGKRGDPIAIRCDQGTEIPAEALDQWAYNNRIEIDFSRPGKLTDNAFAESFDASVKELLKRKGGRARTTLDLLTRIHSKAYRLNVRLTEAEAV